MNIDTSNETVYFSNDKEEITVIKKIFSAFKIKRDRDLTWAWLGVKENKQEFYDMLSDLWIARIIATHGNSKLFEEHILNHNQFEYKIANCSEQVAKLSVIVLTAFSNVNVKKFNKNLDNKIFKDMLLGLKVKIAKKIQYDFQYDQNVKIPFVY